MTNEDKQAVYQKVGAALQALLDKTDRTDTDIHNIGMLTIIRRELRRIWGID